MAVALAGPAGVRAELRGEADAVIGRASSAVAA